ncbi:MAG: hypothetical protein M4D80_25880 [Myxococcota bacterium]|nr:hypothetical protein [Myxococcota bacterium]
MSNQKLSSHMVWVFALASVAAGIGASYAASGLGQKAAAAIYFALVAIGGFASTYLTKARVRGAVLAFITVGAVAAIAYFFLINSVVASATTAVTDGAQNAQAGATFGKMFGIIVGAVVFLETIVAGITGAVIGDKTRGQGGLAAIKGMSRAAS